MRISLRSCVTHPLLFQLASTSPDTGSTDGRVQIILSGSDGFVRPHSGSSFQQAFDAAVITGISVGLVTGFGVPVVIDALFFAREPVPKDTPPAPLTTTLRVTPRLAIVPNGGSVGFGGTF
jgi:hypothetical protein